MDLAKTRYLGDDEGWCGILLFSSFLVWLGQVHYKNKLRICARKCYKPIPVPAEATSIENIPKAFCWW